MLTPEQLKEVQQKYFQPSPTQTPKFQAGGDLSSLKFYGQSDATKPGFVQTAKNDLYDLGQSAMGRWKSLKETWADTASGKINPLETGVQTVGTAVGAVGDVIGAGVKGAAQVGWAATPGVIKEPVKQSFSALMQSEPGKAALSAIEQGTDAYAEFKKNNPRIAKDLESVVNIASILPVGKAAQVGGKAVAGAAKGATTAVKSATKDILEKQLVSGTAKDVARTSKALTKIEGSKANIRNFVEKTTKQGHTPREDVARYGLLHDATDLEGTIRTLGEGGAVERYNKAILDQEGIVNRVLQQEGRTLPLAQVEEAMVEAVRGSGMKGAALSDALAKVKREIEGYKLEIDPSGKLDLEDLLMPVSDVHLAKVDKYSNINYLNDSGRPDKVIAKALKQLVEANSDAEVAALNKELSKHFANIGYLEKLDGAKVEGGRLGKYAAGALGTAIGGSVGGAIGGFGGAAVGGSVGHEVARGVKGRLMQRALRGTGTEDITKSDLMERTLKDVGEKEVAAKAAAEEGVYKVPKFEAGKRADKDLALNQDARVHSVKDLTPEDLAKEQQGYDFIDENAEDIMRQYREQHGKFINVDDLRKYLPTDGTGQAHVTHEPSSEMGKILVKKELDNLKRGEQMSFLAGGAGSGKTSAAKTVSPFDADKYVVDGVLGDHGKAVKAIKEVLKKGGKPVVKYVARDPEDAWFEGVVKRAISGYKDGQGVGRTVPLKRFLHGTEGAYNTARKLLDDPKYEDLVDLIDNTKGFGNQSRMTVDKLKELDYTNLVDKYYEKLLEETTRRYNEGLIPEEIYKGLITG